jgi:hypothetical protein
MDRSSRLANLIFAGSSPVLQGRCDNLLSRRPDPVHFYRRPATCKDF